MLAVTFVMLAALALLWMASTTVPLDGMDACTYQRVGCCATAAQMETSLFSAYPGLMALGGRSSYGDTAPEEIAGKAKFLGQQIVRRKQVGAWTRC
jgi:hypothetical protein